MFLYFYGPYRADFGSSNLDGFRKMVIIGIETAGTNRSYSIDLFAPQDRKVPALGRFWLQSNSGSSSLKKGDETEMFQLITVRKISET